MEEKQELGHHFLGYGCAMHEMENLKLRSVPVLIKNTINEYLLLALSITTTYKPPLQQLLVATSLVPFGHGH